MTHRTEVSLLWLDETDEEWDLTIKESRHSIYPVCGDSADDVKGVLYAKDYFRLKNRTRDNVDEARCQARTLYPQISARGCAFPQHEKKPQPLCGGGGRIRRHERHRHHERSAGGAGGGPGRPT